jgi:hypothetical protein
MYVLLTSSLATEQRERHYLEYRIISQLEPTDFNTDNEGGSLD